MIANYKVSADNEQDCQKTIMDTYEWNQSEYTSNQMMHDRVNNLSENDETDIKSDTIFNNNSNTFSISIPKEKYILPPKITLESREFFRVLQKWEGNVLEVHDDTFEARLVPIIGEGPDQEAEIFLEEVAKDDLELVQKGAIFYWSIGYLDRSSGRIRASILKFQRLPRWSKQSLKNAEQSLDDLKQIFISNG